MIKINLLPRKPRPLTTLWKDASILGGVLFILIFGLLSLSFYMNSQVTNLKKRLEATRKQIADSNLDIEKIKRLKEDKSILENKIGIINALREKQGWPVRVLDDLSTAIPDHIWLQTLTNQGDFLRLEGFTSTYNDVSLFMQRLSKSLYFQNIELENIQQNPVQGRLLHKFRVTCNIKIVSSPPEKTNKTG